MCIIPCKNRLQGGDIMLNKKINELREELNRLIHEQADFDEIQFVSQKLDECLLNYYNEKLEKNDT